MVNVIYNIQPFRITKYFLEGGILLIEIIIAIAIGAVAVYLFYKNVKRKSKGCSGCKGDCENCKINK